MAEANVMREERSNQTAEQSKKQPAGTTETGAHGDTWSL